MSIRFAGAFLVALMSLVLSPSGVALPIDRLYIHNSSNSEFAVQSLNLDGSNIAGIVDVCGLVRGCAGRSIAFDEANGRIYFSNSDGTIYRVNADGSGLMLIADVSNSEEIALDPVGQRLYTSGGRILSFDGIELGTWGASSAVGLALDIVGGHLYYVDGDRTIARRDLDGGNLVSILDLGLGGDFVDIAIDPAADTLFWTQRFGPGQGAIVDGAAIGQARLDGSNPEIIVGDVDLAAPRRIIADPTTERIYWTDGGVFRANYDGSQREIVTLATTHDPHGLALGPAASNYVFPPDDPRPSATASEPTTLAILGLGLAGIGLTRRRRA